MGHDSQERHSIINGVLRRRLGALQGTGLMTARALIADALDLRYRLPRLWGRVLTGGVRAWQARKIAEQTPHLGGLCRIVAA